MKDNIFIAKKLMTLNHEFTQSLIRLFDILKKCTESGELGKKEFKIESKFGGNGLVITVVKNHPYSLKIKVVSRWLNGELVIPFRTLGKVKGDDAKRAEFKINGGIKKKPVKQVVKAKLVKVQKMDRIMEDYVKEREVHLARIEKKKKAVELENKKKAVELKRKKAADKKKVKDAKIRDTRTHDSKKQGKKTPRCKVRVRRDT